MSYRLRIRSAAEADVAEAAQWYSERQLGLGEKFVREVDQAIVRILENPLAFPVILRRHEVRRVLTLQPVLPVPMIAVSVQYGMYDYRITLQ